MKIEEKIKMTITLELSRRDIEYLRDMTRNHLAQYGETEDAEDKKIRQSIFETTNNYLNKPTLR